MCDNAYVYKWAIQLVTKNWPENVGLSLAMQFLKTVLKDADPSLNAAVHILIGLLQQKLISEVEFEQKVKACLLGSRTTRARMTPDVH